ncbi:hypothetical protein B0H17DRAFT_63745 [Mycena rosella]|uniref:Uncharacterized protein n=1 Tax=Mycena rosella TaxID=1033263 RepID=A0AAD7D6A6_MYCRO|nr:hypothetical protein B0H17DRAFT_63745 [Mycena rosella]
MGRIRFICYGGSDTSATLQARTGIFRASTAPWTRNTGKTPTHLRAGPHPDDRDDTATPTRHAPPALLRFDSLAPAPTLFRDDGRARRRLDGDILPPARHEDDSALQCPPPPDVVNRAPQSRSHSRTLLTVPPARRLFARMQAGGRAGVPLHLARDRAEAGARWSSSGVQRRGRSRLGRRRRIFMRRRHGRLCDLSDSFRGCLCLRGLRRWGCGCGREGRMRTRTRVRIRTPRRLRLRRVRGVLGLRRLPRRPRLPSILRRWQRMQLHGLRRRRGALSPASTWTKTWGWGSTLMRKTGKAEGTSGRRCARLCRGYGVSSSTSAAGVGAVSTSPPGASIPASTRPSATRRCDERRFDEERAREEEKGVGQGGLGAYTSWESLRDCGRGRCW